MFWEQFISSYCDYQLRSRMTPKILHRMPENKEEICQIRINNSKSTGISL